jgi:hypothetical protein
MGHESDDVEVTTDCSSSLDLDVCCSGDPILTAI